MTKKTFKRGITNTNFIKKLNSLKADKTSFWAKVLNDKRFFIAIRNEYLSVYYYGQSVAEIRYDDKLGKINCKTHYKYIIQKSDKTPYVSSENGNYRNILLEDLSQIDELTNNVRKYCTIEKTCSYNYLLSTERCLDVEITFSGTKKSIDFVLLNDKGELEFFEAKHCSNPEIVSTTTPKVFEQTDTYIKLVADNYDDIISSYILVANNRKDLGINKELLKINVIMKDENNDPKVNLIVFGDKCNKNWDSQIKKLENKYNKRLIYLPHADETLK